MIGSIVRAVGLLARDALERMRRLRLQARALGIRPGRFDTAKELQAKIDAALRG